MSSSQFRPDSSSLVDLKAEVYRKKEEAKRNKARNIYDESQYVPKIKNKSLKKKEAVVDEEEDVDTTLIHIQDSLRKKAALYDHLKRSSQGKEADDEGLRDRFLVKFKDFEEDEDDFVEYTDPLGRTRKVTREELRALKEEDSSWCDSRPPPSHHLRSSPSQTEEEGSEEALKRELLREKWSQEEEENLRKRDVHYGDLLFDEARTHGTGYYGFSREEVERHKEIDALKELHKETEEAQTASKKSQKAKSRLLAARLKKVRERKRLKMGLPIRPAGMEEENDEDSTKKDSDSEDEKTDKKLEDSIASSLRQMRDKRDAEDRKRKFVREWDLGKKEYHVMSQDDWVREKRSERNSEFAPTYSEDSNSRRSSGSRFGKASTSSYDFEKSRDSETSQPKSSMSMKERLELYSEYTCSSSSSKSERRGAEIPPPVFNDSIHLPKPNLRESFNIGLKEKERLNQKDF